MQLWSLADRRKSSSVQEKGFLLEISSRHADAHKLAESLLCLCSQGFKNEALERMGELHNIRDALLEALNQLLIESHIDS